MEQSKMKRPLVLYHGNCQDGFCAAWVAHRYFTAFIGSTCTNIEAIPVHYGEEPPAVLYRDVYVLDFSYPREVLVQMNSEAASLIVLDHHKTAEEELRGLSYCKFASDKSGARMAWDHFFGPHLESPWLVDYTEDRDLWRHDLPWSREVNANIRSFPRDFDLWDDISDDQPTQGGFLVQGTAIVRREQQIIDRSIERAFEVQLDGHVGLAVNSSVLVSDIAAELAKGRLFGACYFDRKDRMRHWSLRSDSEGVDVSEIAKLRGGGGHKHAAGFRQSFDKAKKGE